MYKIIQVQSKGKCKQPPPGWQLKKNRSRNSIASNAKTPDASQSAVAPNADALGVLLKLRRESCVPQQTHSGTRPFFLVCGRLRFN